MLLWNKIELNNEKKEISEEILKWSFNKSPFLSIISVPYNSTEIFIQIIEYYTNENRNVIYITNEEFDYVNIIATINQYGKVKDYTYIQGLEGNMQSKFKVCNFEDAIKLKQKFELIIYDDINSFSQYNRYEIFDLIDKLSCKNSKVIMYSIENIFKHSMEIFVPVRRGIQIVEPRLILTRIDINRDIPSVIYEYLRWSVDIGKKIIIYVPDEEKLYNVYKYMYSYHRKFDVHIVPFFNGKSDGKIIKEFSNGVKGILVTNSFHKSMFNIKKCDVMIYFADNGQFNYKQFIYLCGGRNIGRGENVLKEEVILLANLENANIERARGITRNFNKKAWKMGLLEI